MHCSHNGLRLIAYLRGDEEEIFTSEILSLDSLGLFIDIILEFITYFELYDVLKKSKTNFSAFLGII